MKAYLQKIFYTTKPDDPLDKAEIILFLTGAFLIGLNYPDFNEPIHEILLLSLIVTVGIFIVFAFTIRRKPYQILIASVILYTIVLIVDATLHPTKILDHFVIKGMVYFLLIKTLQEVKDHTNKATD